MDLLPLPRRFHRRPNRPGDVPRQIAASRPRAEGCGDGSQPRADGEAKMTITPSREEISAIIAKWFPGKQSFRDRCADEILTRLAANSADEGWQDISTAPKNGSAFLASSEGWMTVCHWHRHQQCWSAVGPSYSPYAFNEQPTHWQLLPIAPATTEEPR